MGIAVRDRLSSRANREAPGARDTAPPARPPAPLPERADEPVGEELDGFEEDAPAPGPRAPRSPGRADPRSLPTAEEEGDVYGDDALHERYEDIKRGEIHLTELQKMTMPQLIRTAKAEGVVEYTGLKKQDLIFKILQGAGQAERP